MTPKEDIELIEFRQEADFINNLYGLGDADHNALDRGHIYESMRKFSEQSHEAEVKEYKKHLLNYADFRDAFQHGMIDSIKNGVEWKSETINIRQLLKTP